jgi:hypothetical protein
VGVDKLVYDGFIDLRTGYFHFKVCARARLFNVLIDVVAQLILLQSLLFKLEFLLDIYCPPDEDEVVVVHFCNRLVSASIFE